MTGSLWRVALWIPAGIRSGTRRRRIKKDSGPLTGARSKEEELGPATVYARSPGGKALSTKILCSGGTH
jgi:hypothetical protein